MVLCLNGFLINPINLEESQKLPGASWRSLCGSGRRSANGRAFWGRSGALAQVPCGSVLVFLAQSP